MNSSLKLFFTLAFCLTLVSCSKDDDKDPAAHGSISATVSPAGSATAMRVTKGSTTYEVTPQNNVFTVSEIPAGQYNVTFVPATNYREPAAKNATITAGNTTNLGETKLVKIVQTGSFSATFNGASWAAPVPYGALSNGTMVITAAKTSMTGTNDIIVLNISNFNGTGSYSGPTDAVATYTSVSLLNPTAPSVYNSVPGNCSINITKFDAAGKTISGNFTFTAVSTDLTNPGSVAVTNGVLTDVAYQ